MAIGIYFGDGDFPADRYDEAVGKLDAAGAGAPEGRTLHVALEADGEIKVFDIWESKEAFEAFGQTMMPVMEELGVSPGTPTIFPIRNVIEG